MKIILLQDEKKLGKKGDIIEASEGYARNYILPKKIGVEATSKNMNDLKLQKANEEKVAQENLDAAKALAAELETKQVMVKIKAGEGGKTFGSVSSKEIATACKEQHGIEIDKKKIKLLNRLFAVGYEDEKSIAAMTMDDILALDGISIADISLINELQKAIKCIPLCLCSTVVVQLIRNEQVAGSNPVTSSINVEQNRSFAYKRLG